ncbi:hypothetical protein Tco_1119280 [Tanacetum coccineum]
MTSTSRVWMAASVAVVNGHTEQGYKLRSLVNSFRHGVNVSDLRLFSSLLQSSVSVRDVKTTQSDDCLKQKKGVEPIIEVSNSNPFDVFNSVDNDWEFGTNGETNNLVNNKATSSGLSFMNIDNDRELLDNDGNPLVSTGIVKSDSEVELIFDETANLRILTSGKDESDKGYGTNNLLEQ